jgi:hypothetical protein
VADSSETIRKTLRLGWIFFLSAACFMISGVVLFRFEHCSEIVRLKRTLASEPLDPVLSVLSRSTALQFRRAGLAFGVTDEDEKVRQLR